MKKLPVANPGRFSAEQYVTDFFGQFFSEEICSSPSFRGGQSSAEHAFSLLDLDGYDRSHRVVYPLHRRGVSRLFPWVNHGFLHLKDLWKYSADADPRDRSVFRSEILWYEYARHLYGRLGDRLRTELQRTIVAANETSVEALSMGCVELPLDELLEDGWIPTEAKRWLMSRWVADGGSWVEGERFFFKHLVDGSRALNFLEWQHASGVGFSRSSDFSRWDVEEKAAGLCASCDLVSSCPVEGSSSSSTYQEVSEEPLVHQDMDFFATRGPAVPEATGVADCVWVTESSLGSSDPAMVANNGLPVVFIFDESSLQRGLASSKRLVFLVESLAELAVSRNVEMWLGDPREVFNGRKVAATFTPSPEWKMQASQIDIAAIYPWPWLIVPDAGSVASFSSWKHSVSDQIKSLESGSDSTLSEVR